MSAAQATGTPAAGNPAASTPVTAGTHGLDAILGDLSDTTPVETEGDADSALDSLAAAAGAAETPPEAEADAAEPEPKTPEHPAKVNDEELFSDEALATPEGNKRAAARNKELRRQNFEKYLELKKFNARVVKRHEKLQASIAKHVETTNNDRLVINSMRAIKQGLQSNDPDTKIAALGHLMGMDGFKAFELFTSQLVNRGKTQLDPQVQAILDAQKAELAEVKAALAERGQRETAQQLETRLAAAKRGLEQQVLTSTTTPHLTRIMKDDPEGSVEWLTDQLTDARERGERLDLREFLGQIESQLAKHFGQAAPQGDGATGGAPKQPAQAQRTPNRSIGPQAAAASTRREPSEEESLRALADDPSFLSQFGL